MAAEKDAEEELIFTGKVKKQSVKDPSKFIIECQAVQGWYNSEARMPAQQKPEDVEVGDLIKFKVTETRAGFPITSWVEGMPSTKEVKSAVVKVVAGKTIEVKDTRGDALDSVKRKIEVTDTLYVGKVKCQSKTVSSMYIVDCGPITEWYGAEVKMSKQVKPDDVDVGDWITFTISESSAGLPRVQWAEKAEERPQKKQTTASVSC